MIIGVPPLEIGQQVWGLLSRRPGSTSERSYSMSGGQIHSLDKSGVRRPEKSIPCKATLRASSVPRRITCLTLTSLRRPG